MREINPTIHELLHGQRLIMLSLLMLKQLLLCFNITKLLSKDNIDVMY